MWTGDPCRPWRETLHGRQHARIPCPSPTPGAYSNSCPSSQWCYPTISSSVIPFSSCLQCFPASGSFLMSWLFASGGQSVRASASSSVLPMNSQGWFPLGLTGLSFLQSKALSRGNALVLSKPFSLWNFVIVAQSNITVIFIFSCHNKKAKWLAFVVIPILEVNILRIRKS